MDKPFQIGAQVLSEKMIDCCFHYRKAVLQQIEGIRAIAADASQEFSAVLQSDPQEAIKQARKHNNTISILGSRGTGKTSIIMTLQDDLRHNRQEERDSGSDRISVRNIMMPMLVPQDFAPEQPLLGWVISQLLEKAEEIEREIQNGGNEFASRYIWSNWQDSKTSTMIESPFSKCMEELLTAFDLRYQNQKSVQQVRQMDGEQIYYYMDLLKRDTRLSHNILKLISMIMDYYRHKMHYEHGASFITGAKERTSAAEPLLFFTIDDLDLAPERSSEVLDLVLRYLQHPNVVILCGWNHELFQNHLSIELLRKQGVLNADQFNENFGFDDVFMERARKRVTALDSARRLAADNLKKAFPPAQRYELRSLTTDERASFPYSLNKSREDDVINKRLFSIIEQTILQCAHRPQEQKKRVDFLHNDTKELLVYMRIFDNKARGLINAYKAFEFLLEKQRKLEEQRQKKPNEIIPDLTDDIRNLLDAILFSNTRFAPYRRGIRDLIQIERVVAGDEPELNYYCNFKSVRQTLERYRDAKELTMDEDDHELEQKYDYFPTVIIDVYILLNFMENFLREITHTRVSMHGGKEFSAVLNELRPPLDFTAGEQRRLIQAVRVGGLQELRFFPHTEDFALNIAILDAYEKVGFEKKQYHFTGFDCLKGVLEMVEKLFAPGQESDDSVTNDKLTDMGTALNMDKASNLLRADPEWLISIMRLLMAVQPSEANIKRLAVYTSMLEILGGDSAAARQSAQELANRVLMCDSHQGYRNTKIVPKRLRYGVNNKDLDTLIKCLRTIDNNRTRFLALLQSNKGKEDIVLGKPGLNSRVTYYRARAYLDIPSLYEEPVSGTGQYELLIQSPAECENKLRAISAFKEPELERSPEDRIGLNTVSLALQRADRDISIILRDFKTRLLLSFYENLKNIARKNDENRLGRKYRYIQRSAIAIRTYAEHWELLSGSWGQQETHAATDLVLIFQRNLMADLANRMDDIIEMGFKLENRGRDEYSNMVGQLRQQASRFADMLGTSDRNRMQEALDILAEFPRRIRRNLLVESEIYNTLREIGNEISRELGEVAWEIFSSADGDAEAQLAAWPVSKGYRPLLERLYSIFAILMPKEFHWEEKTLFDIDYSDAELLVQVNVE